MLKKIHYIVLFLCCITCNTKKQTSFQDVSKLIQYYGGKFEYKTIFYENKAFVKKATATDFIYKSNSSSFDSIIISRDVENWKDKLKFQGREISLTYNTDSLSLSSINLDIGILLTEIKYKEISYRIFIFGQEGATGLAANTSFCFVTNNLNDNIFCISSDCYEPIAFHDRQNTGYLHFLACDSYSDYLYLNNYQLDINKGWEKIDPSLVFDIDSTMKITGR